MNLSWLFHALLTDWFTAEIAENAENLATGLSTEAPRSSVCNSEGNFSLTVRIQRLHDRE